MSELLTTRQVQDLLKVDRTTIYRMVEGGQLPALRVGKQWRFPQAGVERWLQDHAAGAPVALTPAAAAASPAHPGPVAGELASVLPLACVQLIQDAFADVLGVMLVVTDMQGRPVTRVSNPCGFVTAAHAGTAAAESCAQTYRQLAAAVTLEPRFVVGELGLLCSRGLIRVGQELKGMLVAGGIAPEAWPPSPEALADLACRLGVDPVALSAHVEEVHQLDPRDCQQVLRFVQRIADIFAHITEDRGQIYGRLQAIASLTSF